MRNVGDGGNGLFLTEEQCQARLIVTKQACWGELYRLDGTPHPLDADVARVINRMNATQTEVK